MDNSPENKNIPISDRKFSRRKFLTVAGGAGIAAAGLATRKLSEEQTKSPEILAHPPEFLGFNTHLYAEPEVPHDLTLDVFKEDIDAMAKEGMNMIRFTVRPWEVAPNGSGEEIIWNEANLNIYKEAAQFAKEKGVQVLLVANTPAFAQAYSPVEYAEVSKKYFSALTEAFHDTVYAIQLFNEADVHHFRDYSAVIPDHAYLQEFARLVKEISLSVKTVSPDMQVTVNAGGWPLNNDRVHDWEEFFAAISPHIDFLSLDLYPDDNIDTINHLDDWVRQLKEEFQKDIMISEIGLPTGIGRFSESDQGKYLSQAINVLKQAGVLGILPYQYRDEARNPNTSEASFGIIHADGTPKQSYTQIIDVMKPDKDKTVQAIEKNGRREN